MSEWKTLHIVGSHLGAYRDALWHAKTADYPAKPPWQGWRAGLSGRAREAIWRLDERLRHRFGIVEFSADPDCILRIELTRARSRLRLPDGTTIEPNDPLIELHFWNEHLPRMGRRGVTVAWARQISHRMRFSLRELARYVAAHPEAGKAKAITGRVAFSLPRGRRRLGRLGAHYGFDVSADERPMTLGRRLHDAGENILLWMILWACNPADIRHARFLRPRSKAWMSLATLTRRYGEAGNDAADDP